MILSGLHFAYTMIIELSKIKAKGASIVFSYKPIVFEKWVPILDITCGNME